MVTNGIEVVLYISAWGLCVARFDRQGNAKASEREASDSAGLHVFFVSEQKQELTLWLSEARYPTYLMWERYGADR